MVITRLLAWSRASDPDRSALRRGARTAITVPMVILLLTHVPPLSSGTMMGSFAALGLLVFADFGGPAPARFRSYLYSTLAGMPLMVIGAYASQRLWTAVLTMAAVAVTVGVLAVLRGPIGGAQRLLLLVTVLSLTSSNPSYLIPDLLCWLLGGLAAGIAAIALWPVYPQRTIESQLAGVLNAIAGVCEVRWVEQESGARLEQAGQRLESALLTLHAHYDGDLLRPAGVTGHSRALAELVNDVTQLDYLLHWRDVGSGCEPQLQRITTRIAGSVSAALRQCAGRLCGQDTGPLSVPDLVDATHVDLDEMADWLQARRGHADPDYLRMQLEDTFPVRMTRVVTAQVLTRTIQMDGRDADRDFADSETAGAGPGRPGLWARLRPQLSWDSPWLRNSLRSAVALSLSVAVARMIPPDHHPFWVVLGTLSALRFDALGTGRTARHALVGTSLGVGLSVVAILVIGDHRIGWAVLFPIALFLAAYTPGVVTFQWSQAAFTLVVIVLFSLTGPPRVHTATDRLLDVALGLMISLIVGLLIWPRGVIQTLSARLREAMVAAGDFYVASVDWLVGGAINDRLLADHRVRAHHTIERAKESLDLSIVQRPPESVSVDVWTALTNTLSQLNFAALSIPRVAHTVAVRGHQGAVPPQLTGPVLLSTNQIRDRLTEVTRRLERGEPTLTGDDPFASVGPEVGTTSEVRQLREAIGDYLRTPSDWAGSGPDPRPVVATWLSGWDSLFGWSAVVMRTAADALARDRAAISAAARAARPHSGQ